MLNHFQARFWKALFQKVTETDAIHSVETEVYSNLYKKFEVFTSGAIQMSFHEADSALYFYNSVYGVEVTVDLDLPCGDYGAADEESLLLLLKLGLSDLNIGVANVSAWVDTL